MSLLSFSSANRAAIGIALLIVAPLLAAASPPPQPRFDVIRFFEGRTEGQGVLKVVLRSPETIRVQSRGRVQPDGSLLLVQAVQQGEKPRRTREWKMRQLSPGRYTGTLTDAVGPVRAEVEGNRLRIRFRLKGGLDAEQWLTLAADGRSAANVLRVRKFGVMVARLDETIRKLD